MRICIAVQYQSYCALWRMNNEYYVDNGLSIKQETVIKKCK